MRNPFRRHRAAAAPRPNPTAISVMENDLLGIAPQPGTMAALAVALRGTGTCLTHLPVSASKDPDGPADAGVCAGCGADMVLGDDGTWRRA
ncbi:hypothetical protein KCMC57_63720 (plasmid) [Kitasatospora sp. CMC57]|uniref:Uncharacterized protein n=1 Tax=Kitasatospora sp. CMC57 TaxID=3231513 RepID=A0AB33K953_9ACTN